jgi:pimeloyl-ACP methyl ester carboxylesterase
MNYRLLRSLALSMIVPLWMGCASTKQEQKPMPDPNDQSAQDDSATPNEDATAQDRLGGTWQGALEVSGAELTIVFHLDKAGAPDGDGSQSEGQWTGTMDSPDQGATGIPVSKVTLDANTVRLTVAEIGGVYEGTLVDDTKTIEGTWTQGTSSFALDVTRVASAKAKGVSRPQHPEAPFPYSVEDVEFAGGEPTSGTDDAVRLAGTLTLPESEGPHPVLILVTGSGPQDRDETIAGHKPFLVLADHLTRRGVAVLRYDDRGVGESTGAFKDATIADFTADAAAAVDFLAARSDIDADSIGVGGHSEGANVAPRASLINDKVAFLVLLAPTAVPGTELLARQNALVFEGMGMSAEGAKAYEKHMLESITRLLDVPLDEPVADELRAQLRADFEAAAKAMSAADRAIYGPTDPAEFDSVLDGLVGQLTMAWMRSFLAMTPVETFKRVDVPLLAVFGSKDVQVSAEQNAPVLRAALAEHPDATIEVLDGLNHLFQPAKTGLPVEYSTITTTLAPELLDAISAWLDQQSAGQHAVGQHAVGQHAVGQHAVGQQSATGEPTP